MIKVESLTKKYGDRTAVSELDFEIAKGQVVGFLGPNGAGKSTTLRMLTGYLPATSGQIHVDGIDVETDSIEARRRIGYMPEAVPLYDEMRVDEYLRYRAALKGVAKKDITRMVDAALQKADVTDVRSRIIGQLSKGYKQRVGIADALVADPPILILDEPTAGLDPNQIRQVRDLIKTVAHDKTIILSTHILPEVESTCSHVLVLHRGKLVAKGTIEELRGLRKPIDGSSVATILARGDREAIQQTLVTIDGVLRLNSTEMEGDFVRIVFTTDGTDALEHVFRAFSKTDFALRELRPVAESLQDVFAELTTKDTALSVEPPS